MDFQSREITIEQPRKSKDRIEFFYLDFPANTMACKAHIHSVVELIFIQKGSFSAIIDSQEYIVKEGDLLLFCSNTIHNMYSQGEAENAYFVIKIPPEFFIEISGNDQSIEYVMRFAVNRSDNKKIWTKDELSVSPILPVLNQLIDEYGQKRYANDIAIKLKVMELLVTILRCDHKPALPVKSTVTEIIYKIINYIHHHYFEDIVEEELARSFGLSYTYFSRNFKTVVGMSFKKYLNITRVNYAEKMLLGSNKSVSEVATACGYNNISYFIKVYRSIKEKTPYKTSKSK